MLLDVVGVLLVLVLFVLVFLAAPSIELFEPFEDEDVDVDEDELVPLLVVAADDANELDDVVDDDDDDEDAPVKCEEECDDLCCS